MAPEPTMFITNCLLFPTSPGTSAEHPRFGDSPDGPCVTMSRCDPKLPARSFGGQHLLGLEPATPPPVAQKYGRTEGEQGANRSPSHKGHPHPDASSPTSLS